MVQSPQLSVTDEELMLMSAKNPELRFERNANGSLIVMPPTGGISGNREIKSGAYLLFYVESHDLGEVFGSSTGFKLPNGAVRSPDAAFIAKGRLPQNWDQVEDKFITVVPDFVIEIRSKSDSLTTLQDKMQEYIEQGVRLGWLFDRQGQQVWVYRADRTITQYPASATLSGEEVVPEFSIAAQKLL